MPRCEMMNIIHSIAFGMFIELDREKQILLSKSSFVYWRHYPDDDTVSMCSENSVLMSSFDGKANRPPQPEGEYPANWTIDDVIKWLSDISLQQYSDNFRKHDIDGSVLVDEIDGVNDETIKQLIPPLGTQLKFKRALRSLRR